MADKQQGDPDVHKGAINSAIRTATASTTTDCLTIPLRSPKTK